MNTILEFLEMLINPVQASVLAGLIVANLGTGVLAAALNGTFDTSKLADFWKRAATIFVAYLALGFIAHVATDWAALQTTMWAFLIAFMGDKIFKNLSEMGLPVPENIPLVNKLVNVPGVMLKNIKK